MIRKVLVVTLFVTLVSAAAMAQDARTAIGSASEAIGAEGLNSITYSGSASNVNFGQTPNSKGPWQGVPVTNYTRSIDLTQPASRATGTTAPPAPAPPGNYNQNITPANAAWTQQLELWITPWGFLKGAAANSATVRTQRIGGKNFNVVSWKTPQKAPSGMAYTVNGYINDQNLVERVETWVEHPILGDMLVEATYTDYRAFGTAKVPTKIVQKRGGWPTFEATITAASANPANIAALLQPPPAQGGQRGAAPAAAAPAAPAAAPAAPAAPAPLSVKLAEGVHRITGNYGALVIEFPDHMVVLEGGQSEARGLAVIAEAKRLIPNKPIRYVVNTHPHFDHASGLAPFVAEGATIITHENNKDFLEMALSTPRTLVGDSLAKANRKPTFETVGDRKVLRAGTRVVELHHVRNMAHSDGMVIAYLPAEKILFQGDFTLPAAGQPANASIVTLVENLDRLKLDFDKYVPVHPPTPDVPWTRTDLMKSVGRAN